MALTARDVIEQDPDANLATTFSNVLVSYLPVQSAVCCSAAVDSSTSQQARAAWIGFAKENQAGIPLDAAERNYKDAKP